MLLDDDDVALHGRASNPWESRPNQDTQQLTSMRNRSQSTAPEVTDDVGICDPYRGGEVGLDDRPFVRTRSAYHVALALGIRRQVPGSTRNRPKRRV